MKYKNIHITTKGDCNQLIIVKEFSSQKSALKYLKSRKYPHNELFNTEWNDSSEKLKLYID